MIIPIKDKTIRVRMAAVAAKPTDRVITIRHMEGIYRAPHNLAKDKEGRRRDKGSHSNKGSMEVRILCPGGLIDVLEQGIDSRINEIRGLEEKS